MRYFKTLRIQNIEILHLFVYKKTYFFTIKNGDYRMIFRAFTSTYITEISQQEFFNTKKLLLIQ